jgi:hypothetical protein
VDPVCVLRFVLRPRWRPRGTESPVAVESRRRVQRSLRFCGEAKLCSRGAYATRAEYQLSAVPSGYMPAKRDVHTVQGGDLKFIIVGKNNHCVPTLCRHTQVYVVLHAATCVDLCRSSATSGYVCVHRNVGVRAATSGYAVSATYVYVRRHRRRT